MERHLECEKFILRTLQRGACRIEAFDGREFNKATVNAAITYLLHEERIHSGVGFTYHLGPPPVHIRKRKIPKPNFAMAKPAGRIPEHKIRAKKFTGELTDKSSAERRR